MGEVINFLTQNNELGISKEGKKIVSSFPMLWDEVEAMKVHPIKVFSNDEIAAYMASGAEPPESYPWRSKSRQLARVPRKKGEARRVRN